MAIQPEPYEVAAEDVVNLIGRSFNFTHQKGIVEWVKNSWDAYQRKSETNNRTIPAYVVVEFDGSGKSFRTVRVADFCGMTPTDIDRAFKRWFDMRAASGGSSSDTLAVLGGHGNGGKFYMRQRFAESRITTWIRGELSQFGFNAKQQYGWVTDRKGYKCSLAEALEIAGLPHERIPDEARMFLEAGDTGFTVVSGYKAKGRGIQTQVANVIEALRRHPQMQRLLPQMQMSVWQANHLRTNSLSPETPDLHPDIRGEELSVPGTIEDDGEYFVFSTADTTGKLDVRVAASALSNRSKAFNRMDVVGRTAVVASYPMNELPLKRLDGAEFLMATLACSGVEKEEESLVENDRERLIQSPKTSALLSWTASELDRFASRVAAYNAKEGRVLEAAETARLTRMINRYAEQFLRDFYTEITGGPGKGPSFGGTGGGGDSVHSNGKASDGDKKTNAGDSADDDGGGRGDQPGRARRYPEVLVAGVDPDPFSPDGTSLQLSERYPTLYQRPNDVDARIYWINTEATYPRILLEKFGETSSIWKNYVLLRHRDVVVKEALRHLTDAEGLDLTAENINNRMDELTDQFLNSLDQAVADAIFGM